MEWSSGHDVQYANRRRRSQDNGRNSKTNRNSSRSAPPVNSGGIKIFFLKYRIRLQGRERIGGTNEIFSRTVRFSRVPKTLYARFIPRPVLLVFITFL